jgi:hypothetical protein
MDQGIGASAAHALQAIRGRDDTCGHAGGLAAVIAQGCHALIVPAGGGSCAGPPVFDSRRPEYHQYQRSNNEFDYSGLALSLKSIKLIPASGFLNSPAPGVMSLFFKKELSR